MSAGKVFFTLLGIAAGLVFSGVVLYVWRAFWPRAWKRHWYVQISPRDRPDGDWHSFLSLVSRHYHTIINLTCVVTTPNGQEWQASFKPQGASQLLLSPGHHGGPLVYPNGFGAPWPEPGKYKVAWFMDVEHGTKPIKLAGKRWKVTELPWDYSSSGSPSPS